MTEYRRMILKISDLEGEVATIPSTNDHSDGSWLNTDIYVGELFLNIADDVLQTRTETGIINLISGGSGVTNFLGLTDTPSVYTGSGSYVVKVKADETGLEFVDSVASVAWGGITGTLSSQTDLQSALDAKQVTLVSGTNIKTINSNSLLGSGNIVVAEDFTDLNDTPSTYTGQGGKLVAVNSGETALEFVDETDETLITTLTIGTDRTLILSDRNKNIENDADVIITVPPNSSVAFPIGTQIFFTKKFESVTFVAGAGVTINSVDSLLEMGRINCGASLLKIATDEWNLIGELV